MPLESRSSLKQIAQNTPHYTGADLKAVLYSAQLRAAHRALDAEKMNEKREVSPGVSSEKDGRGTAEGWASVRVYKLGSGQCTEPQPELQKQVLQLPIKNLCSKVFLCMPIKIFVILLF